jgi:hypothetical protein
MKPSISSFQQSTIQSNQTRNTIMCGSNNYFFHYLISKKVVIALVFAHKGSFKSRVFQTALIIDYCNEKLFRFKAIAALVLLIIIGAILPCSANLRAPGMAQFMGSGAIKKMNGIVLSEKLILECDQPYTAKHIKRGVLSSGPHSVQVTAIYTIMSPMETQISTSFVLADPMPVTVEINGKSVKTETPVKISTGESEPHRFRTIDNTLYEASFSGKLIKGLNTIAIRYRQPMGFFEAHHGYFVTSRFHSFFTYALWPLKDWNLSKDFRLDITVSTRDDTGITKVIWGSDYRIKLYGNNKEKIVTEQNDVQYQRGHQAIIKTTVLDTPRDILTVISSSDAGFPDVLTIVIGQTEDMD